MMGADALSLSLESASKYRSDLNYWVSYVISVFDSNEKYLTMHTPLTIVTHLIPRSIWPTKPLGLGAVITSGHLTNPQLALGVKTTWTVAVGLAGEGYANGGILGILGMSAAAGWLCGTASRLFTVAVSSTSLRCFTLGLIARSVAVGFVRGDVLSAWIAYVEPLVFSIAALWLIRPFFRRRLVVHVTSFFVRG